MDKSKPDQRLDKGVKSPKVLDRGKEATVAPVRIDKNPTHNKETHGLRDDIDVNTPISDVKGPNVFERVKEEVEAIAEMIQSRKEDKNQNSPSSVGRDETTSTGLKQEKQSSLAGSLNKIKTKYAEVKTATLKEKSPSSRRKETHGRGEDIDADIPIGEFKGPNIFHRAKEEIEAIVDTVQSKKESDRDATSQKEGGLRASISKKLNTIRSNSKSRSGD